MSKVKVKLELFLGNWSVMEVRLDTSAFKNHQHRWSLILLNMFCLKLRSGPKPCKCPCKRER